MRGFEQPQLLMARLGLLLSLYAPWVGAQDTRVDGQDPGDREIQAEAPDRPKEMPLSLLPEPRSLELRAPRPAALEAIDQLLSDIVSQDTDLRARTEVQLRGAKTDWVSGIERRVNRLAERADRAKMKETFERIRELHKKGGMEEPSADYLNGVLAFPSPLDQSWRDLTQLLAMSHMLAATGTTDAARVVIFIYSRFGEFMRIECQRQLDEIGEPATAALIDARRHPAPKIASWAERLLSLRNTLAPHDAVRTDDSTALAEILVALGRSRDPEVTNLLLSFAASDRAGVQQAAREGLVLLGEVGSWQLMDAYKNITGKTPPRDWTWKRTARELFSEYDRLKLEEAYALFTAGQKALKDKRFSETISAYNRILAQVPSFQQSKELAEGYFVSAQALQTTHPELALEAAFRAEHLFSEPKARARAEALRRLLQAKELKKQGWIDQAQLARAGALDPQILDQSTSEGRSSAPLSSWGDASRYLVAIVVSALSLAGAAWILVSTWFRKQRPAALMKDSASSASTAGSAAKDAEERIP